MISDIFPTVLIAFLSNLIFGFLFNQLVKWIAEHKHWDVSISVVIGVFFTVLIPTLLFIEHWQFSAVLYLCFSASGLPMIAGSLTRRVERNNEIKKKKARPLGNLNAKLRDYVVADIARLTEDMALKAQNESLDPRWMVEWLHKLHVMSRILKNM